MFSFIRQDLSKLTAYTPHPGGIAGKPAESAVILDRLDSNECPYDLPLELKEKLARIYQYQLETNRYPDGSHETLKETIAEYVNEALSSPFVTRHNLSVGNGSDELIRSLLIATCLGGAGSILVANPTFSMYEIIAKTLGISVVSIGRDEQNFQMDIEQAQRVIKNTDNPPVRVIFVVHPNSPTANALTVQELNWLEHLPENILVVIDEAYFEFSQTTVLAALQNHPNWIILRTFSKAFRLASMRVGYGIAHPELIHVLEKVRLPYNLPAISQQIARLALNNRRELLSVISEVLEQRMELITQLTALKNLQVWPSAANFIYMRCKSDNLGELEMKHTQFMQQLKAQGTLIRHTGGGLRITIGTPEENQRTLERLKSLNSTLSPH